MRNEAEFVELSETGVLCQYCTFTNFGEYPSGYAIPGGYVSCEGSHCEDAYEYYLENKEEEE